MGDAQAPAAASASGGNGNGVSTVEQYPSRLGAGTDAATPTWVLGAVAEQDRPAAILILESSALNRKILRETLRAEVYQILEAAQPVEAFEVLRREPVDLVVIELMIPGLGGLEFCRQMKTSRETQLIPILVFTSLQGAENEIASIASGADEFLVKPLHPDIVRTRIRAMLRHKAALDSREEAETILFSLAQAVEHRDKCTAGHCERLSSLSLTLGMALALPESHLLALHRGGYLHDIGKVSIPDSILFKPGRLTDDEWAVMRTHTVHGEDICRHVRTLGPVLPIIRHHHERWDGSGYPDGLSGERIPLAARILQVADIFDALTSERPYKTALPPAEALDILDEEARRGWRDPKLVRLFRRLWETQLETGCAQNLAPWTLPDPVSRSLESMRQALASSAPLGPHPAQPMAASR